jgi:hypothetical protein
MFVVTGDHYHFYAGPAAGQHRLNSCRPGGVDHAGQAKKDKSLLNIYLRKIRGVGGKFPVGKGYNSQCFIGKFGILVQDFFPLLF